MVIGIDGGTAASEIRRNSDAPLVDREPPRLRVVAVGGQRGIAHQLIEAALGPEGRPGGSHCFIVGNEASPVDHWTSPYFLRDRVEKAGDCLVPARPWRASCAMCARARPDRFCSSFRFTGRIRLSVRNTALCNRTLEWVAHCRCRRQQAPPPRR